LQLKASHHTVELSKFHRSILLFEDIYREKNASRKNFFAASFKNKKIPAVYAQQHFKHSSNTFTKVLQFFLNVA